MGVRSGLEQREFLLQNDAKFHRQIHSIKREPMPGGAFRYDSARDEQGHADSFWAWALANYAVVGKQFAKEGFYQQWKREQESKLNGLVQKPDIPAEAAVSGSVRQKGKSLDRLLRNWATK